MKLSELSQDEIKTANFQTEAKKKNWLTNNPLVNLGVGIGSSIGKGIIGTAEVAAKLALPKGGLEEKVVGGLEKVKSNIYQKPFEKELSTISGKTGEVVGDIAQFVAPSGLITKGQKAFNLVKQVGKQTPKIMTALSNTGKVLTEMAGTGATEYLKSGGDKDKAKSAALTAGILTTATKSLGKLGESSFWPKLQGSVNKALQVNQKSSGGTVIKNLEQKAKGIQVLEKYAPVLNISDDIKSPEYFDVKKANYFDTIKAWNQARKEIFNRYHSIAEKSGQTVKTDITPMVDELNNVLTSKTTSQAKDAAKNILKELQDNFSIKLNDKGGVIYNDVNALDLEKYISDLGQQASGALQGATDKAYSKVAAQISNAGRKVLDDIIERSTGQGAEYQALKNEYGALKSIEQDLVKVLQKQARQVGGGIGDWFQIFNSGDLVAGMISQNPQYLAQGLAKSILGFTKQNLSSPDRFLKRAFKQAGQAKKTLPKSDISKRLFGI
jgi:hypothetical protein